MKKKFVIFTFFLFSLCHLFAQLPNGCSAAEERLQFIEQRLHQLNSHNPELITLHFVFLKDYQKELQRIETEGNDFYFYCDNKIKLLKKCQSLLKLTDSLYPIFEEQSRQVDDLFYHRAKIEYVFHDYEQAEYFLGRALQYNRHNLDALLLKANVLFEQDEYADCLEVIKDLFKHQQLDEAQENAIYDLSSKYYYKLYNLGDSLVKADKGAYAIDLFQLLESFCHDVPSTYCNDDYYKGILQSKEGIYESYIAIAKAARARGNFVLEKKFLKYAQEYLEANQELNGSE